MRLFHSQGVEECDAQEGGDLGGEAPSNLQIPFLEQLFRCPRPTKLHNRQRKVAKITALQNLEMCPNVYIILDPI